VDTSISYLRLLLKFRIAIHRVLDNA